MKICTKLKISIFLNALVICLIFCVTIIEHDIAFKFIFIILIFFFIQFLFSKKVFCIIIEEEIITISYLFFRKKTEVYLKGDLYVQNLSKVQYRGGKIDYLQIFDVKKI
jgi:hypothetical protein